MAEKKHPNIIIILADDMGWGDLSCYGAEKIHTPNMDGIAEAGVTFTDAHSSSAVCTPSRYSIVTGRYCWRSDLDRGVLGGFGKPLIEDGRHTIASMLKEHGYHTGAVGKWHLGLRWLDKEGKPVADYGQDGWNTGDAWHVDGLSVDYTKRLEGGPVDHGFDYWFGIAGSLDMPPYCFIENDRPEAVPEKEKQPYEAQQRKGLMTEGWRDDQVDVRFAEKASAFIDNHAAENPDRPFFLYINPAAPHRPCVPPEFIKGKSEAGLRGDAVVLVDWLVGQVQDALARNKLEENTLFIVTSDNGARLTNFDGKDYGHKSNGDWRGGKADIWDGGHREPLVMKWPERVKPGVVRDDLVCLGDFMATCAEIVGAELPPESAEDSFSFLHALTGEKPTGEVTPVREDLVHHSYDGMFSLRRGDWKFIDGNGSGGFSEPARWTPGPEDPKGQLYNIRNDFRENLNLWKARQDIVTEYKELLEKYKREGRTRPR
jgi:arylsulfatase A-like enzyme